MACSYDISSQGKASFAHPAYAPCQCRERSGIGLGSCWINRAKETFETPEGKALLAKWGLDPEKYIGVGYCILGYPAPNGTRTPGPRKAGYVLHV